MYAIRIRPNETVKEAKEKYSHLDRILKNERFEFAVILLSNGLKQECINGYVDSETKRIIDAGIKELFVHGTEPSELLKVEAYAEMKGCQIETFCGSPEDAVKHVKPDDRRGLAWVNGLVY